MLRRATMRLQSPTHAYCFISSLLHRQLRSSGSLEAVITFGIIPLLIFARFDSSNGMYPPSTAMNLLHDFTSKGTLSLSAAAAALIIWAIMLLTFCCDDIPVCHAVCQGSMAKQNFQQGCLALSGSRVSSILSSSIR